MIDIPRELLLTLLLRAFVGGGVLGIFYSALRLFKMLFGVSVPNESYDSVTKLQKVLEFSLTFVVDIIFWILAALLSVAILYSTGGGRFRAVIYPIMAVGFALWHLTLGRVLLRISALAVRFFKRMVSKLIKFSVLVLKFILHPFILIYRLTIGVIVGKIKEAAEKRRKKNQCEPDASIAESDCLSDGKEDFVYVDGKKGYRKEGRISFGGRSDG